MFESYSKPLTIPSRCRAICFLRKNVQLHILFLEVFSLKKLFLSDKALTQKYNSVSFWQY
jgi:hypothetical protein